MPEGEQTRRRSRPVDAINLFFLPALSAQRKPSGFPLIFAMKVEIVHSTHYQYSGPIAESVMEVRLQPMDGVGQRCLAFALDISSGIKPRSYVDGYGNVVHYFNLVRPHTRLSITSRSTVETGLPPDE